MAISTAERRVLGRGLHDFGSPEGRDMLARCTPLEDWVDESSAHGLFQFLRHHCARPSTMVDVQGWGGQRYRGLNLGSQDYLGLSAHPTVVSAAIEACRIYGTHSAGSEPMGGGLADARRLERRLGAFLGFSHVVLFPSGWAAGYGTIKALVRPYDHIVIDALAHDCLRQGAAAATPHVHNFAHNDMVSLDRRLGRIRASAPAAAILAVTESLFSMDSDHPEFAQFIEVCRKYDATTLIDVAHDFGAVGPGGAGLVAAQGCLAEVDIVMGSFSKTFASVGGFCATNAKGASYAVRGYSGSYTFSNYLPPAQIAAVHAALDIVQSPEGDVLRTTVHERSQELRHALAAEGLPVLGRISPIVLPLIGNEAVARLAYRHCLLEGLILNSIEYPACRRGQARFRLQVTPAHTVDDLRLAATTVGRAIRRARVDANQAERAVGPEVV